MIDEAYSEYAALSYEAAVGVVDPVERLRVGALGALRVATARTEPFTAQLARSTVAPGRPRARHETRVPFCCVVEVLVVSDTEAASQSYDLRGCCVSPLRTLHHAIGDTLCSSPSDW